MLSGRFGLIQGLQRTENRHWGPIPWNKEGAISGWIKPRGDDRIKMPRPWSKALQINSAFVCEITRTHRNVSSTTFQDSCDILYWRARSLQNQVFGLFPRAGLEEALCLTASSFGNISILSQVFKIFSTNAGKCAEHGRHGCARVSNQIVNYRI